MRNHVSFALVKTRLSIKTTSWIMSRWRYALLAIAIAVLFFELIYWLFNLPVLTTILTSGNVTLIEKLTVLASPVQSIGAVSGNGLLVMMIILAIVQGISIATLMYIIRRQRKLDDKLIGGSSFVALLAIIGLGCPACGTSLITPIVALFVSGSAVVISEKITIVATPVALAVGLYGLYVIGLKAANTRALAVQNDS